MPNNLKAAVIGVGVMGKHHVAAYANSNHITLVGVADPNVKLGRSIASRYKIPCYTDYLDLLSELQPDLISVCAPAPLHFKITLDCLRHNCHVLVEKPIAATISDAESLLSAANQYQRQLMVGHIERYNSVITSVKKLLTKNTIGNIVSLVTRRCSPYPHRIKDADVALELAIHDVDLSNYLINSLPISTKSVKRTYKLSDRIDSASYLLEYSSCNAYIHVNWLSLKRTRKLEIQGTKGRINADLLDRKIIVSTFKDKEYLVKPVNALQLEIAHFIKTILAQKPLDASYALEALRIVLE